MENIERPGRGLRAGEHTERVPQSFTLEPFAFTFREKVSGILKNIEQQIIAAKKRGTEKQNASDQRKTVQAIDHRMKRFVKRLSQLSIIAMLGMTANHIRVHEKIEKQEGVNEPLFQHPDEETTHILNYFAGKEALSSAEKLRIIKMGVEHMAQEADSNLPSGFYASKFDLSQVEQYVYTLFGDHITKQEIQKGLQEMYNQIQDRFEYNPALYQAIWEIEQHVGAPYLQWTVGSERYTKGRLDTAQYNPLTNTISVNPFNFNEETFNKEFLSEAAHAQQFYEDPIESYYESVEATIRIGFKIVTRGMSLRAAQQQEYTMPGTLEYEAHQIMQPELEKKLREQTQEEQSDK